MDNKKFSKMFSRLLLIKAPRLILNSELNKLVFGNYDWWKQTTILENSLSFFKFVCH